MREKLLTFGKDFEIKEASHRRGGHGPGKAKYYVDNKNLRARETFNIRSSRLERYCTKSKNVSFVFVIP